MESVSIQCLIKGRWCQVVREDSEVTKLIVNIMSNFGSYERAMAGCNSIQANIAAQTGDEKRIRIRRMLKTMYLGFMRR